MYRVLVMMAAVVAILSGCAEVPPAQLAAPEHLVPIQGLKGQSKTIFIANTSVKLVDKKIGQLVGGILCAGGTDLIWGDKPGIVNTMQQQMVRTLSDNGYNVYSGFIQTAGERDADILVGASIEDIKANMCYTVDGQKGAASLTLRWEVLDNKTKKSFFVSGSGTASVENFSKTGDPDVFIKAIKMATENILAQESFSQATRK